MNNFIKSFSFENLLIFSFYLIFKKIQNSLSEAVSEWAWVSTIMILLILIFKLVLSIIFYRLTYKLITKKLYLYYFINFIFYVIILQLFDKDFIYNIFTDQGLRINIFLLSHFLGTLIMVVCEYGKGRDGRIS